MSEVIVEVTEGKLKGEAKRSENGIQMYTFRGIPFAKPPIGELRFAIPVQPEPWEGVRDATKSSNFCIQFDIITNEMSGTEDCLYLNVYTPVLPPNKVDRLPVLVYIHPGGFMIGSGTNDRDHGMDYLVEKGVVVVGINYRLGILGFLSLDKKEAPGNMGLRDQVMALKWVQKNIAQFGGDPNNVTLFGISAGAASVEYLVLSPMARGYFHKAIAQAGSTLLPWALNRNVKQLAYKIPKLQGKEIKNDDDLYQYLKGLPIEELIKLAAKAVISSTWKGGIHFGFVPTIENAIGDRNWVPFLDESPYVLLKRGDFAKVPYLAGFSNREGLLMEFFSKSTIENLAKDKDFFKYLPFSIDDTNKSILEKKLIDAYVNNGRSGKDSVDFAFDFFTDVDFLGGINVAVSSLGKYIPSVYFYQFSYDGGLNALKRKFNINRSGACHADDEGYILKLRETTKNPSATDVLVRDRLTEMWTNFAKYGNPTPVIDSRITTKWEPVNRDEVVYLNIDENLTMQKNLLPKRTKLFEELYDKFYP